MDQFNNNLNQAENLTKEVRSDIRELRERYSYMFELPLELIPEEELVSDEKGE